MSGVHAEMMSVPLLCVCVRLSLSFPSHTAAPPPALCAVFVAGRLIVLHTTRVGSAAAQSGSAECRCVCCCCCCCCCLRAVMCAAGCGASPNVFGCALSSPPLL